MHIGSMRFTGSCRGLRFRDVYRVNIQHVAFGIGIENELPIQRSGAGCQGLGKNIASGSFVAAELDVSVIDQAPRRDAHGDWNVCAVAQLLAN